MNKFNSATCLVGKGLSSAFFPLTFCPTKILTWVTPHFLPGSAIIHTTDTFTLFKLVRSLADSLMALVTLPGPESFLSSALSFSYQAASYVCLGVTSAVCSFP